MWVLLAAAIASASPPNVASMSLPPPDQRDAYTSTHARLRVDIQGVEATTTAAIGGTELTCELWPDGELHLDADRLHLLPDPLPPAVTCAFDGGAAVTVALRVQREAEQVDADTWVLPIGPSRRTSSNVRIEGLQVGTVRARGIQCEAFAPGDGDATVVSATASRGWMRRARSGACTFERVDGAPVTVQVVRRSD